MRGPQRAKIEKIDRYLFQTSSSDTVGVFSLELSKAMGYRCETVDFSVNSNLLSLLTSFLPGLIDGNIQYEHGELRG